MLTLFFYCSTYQTRNLWLVTGISEYLLYYFKGKVKNFYHDKILIRFMIFHAKDMYCKKVMHALLCCWMNIKNTFTHQVLDYSSVHRTWMPKSYRLSSFWNMMFRFHYFSHCLNSLSCIVATSVSCNFTSHNTSHPSPT